MGNVNTGSSQSKSSSAAVNKAVDTLAGGVNAAILARQVALSGTKRCHHRRLAGIAERGERSGILGRTGRGDDLLRQPGGGQ
jgi:hypothetical protein